MCKDLYLERVETLTSNLRLATKLNAPLKAGSLMHFVVPGAVDGYFLVGCVIARPCAMYIFVECTLVRSGILKMRVSETCTAGPEALITTSAMTFKNMLTSIDSRSPDAKHIDVSTLRFDCGNDSLDSPDQFLLSIVGKSFEAEVSLLKQEKGKAKPAPKLPFGFLRASKQSKRPKVKPLEPKNADVNDIPDICDELSGSESSSDSASSSSDHSEDQHSECSLCPSSSGSSGSSSSGGSSSGPKDVHVDISVADLDGHEECVAKEEAAAHACPAPLLDMAAASTTAVCDSLHYMDVGIIGVGFAKTGAAACHLCGHKILCGSIRFKYIWKKNKPSKWIHRDCVGQIPDSFRPTSLHALVVCKDTLAPTDADQREAVETAIASLQ
jgi:hypothetical protein